NLNAAALAGSISSNYAGPCALEIKRCGPGVGREALVLRRKLAKLHNIVPRGTTMQTAPSDVPVSPNRDPLLIDLALQGGGAHGACTWVVLDRLLEEPWLRIDGISGASA